MSLVSQIQTLATRIATEIKETKARVSALEPAYRPIGPAFSYSGGRLIGITYDDGATKTLTYDANGRLAQIDTTAGAVTTRKTFNYTNGLLTSIDEGVI